MLVFTSAAAASAFCLFLIQPLLAKQLLPWFGGSSAVWAACMVFYQALLLAGYLYAHALSRWLKPKTQAALHLCLIGVSLAALPLGLHQTSRPAAAPALPEVQVVWILLRTIGLPYFVLSTTTPLVQGWLARLDPSDRTYRLFGLSNLSCAIALLAFPLLLEPWLPLPAINRLWSIAYALTVASLAAAAVFLIRRGPTAALREARDEAGPTATDRAAWLGYSALGAALMIGITNHLCQTVAPMPLLWTLPLLAYLLSFTAVFEREWYARRVGMTSAALAIVAMSWLIVYLPAGRMIVLGIPVFAAGCFLACFFCHGELARSKPGAARLTEFYIFVAGGGALGSLLVAFAAPLVFRSLAELPVALAVAGLLILSLAYRRDSVPLNIAAACCAVLTFGPAVAQIRPKAGEIEGGRNFFGVLRVVEDPGVEGKPPLRKLIHGGISHGSQFQGASWQKKPISYYGPNSAPGVWFRSTSGARRVGVVGLGAGTLAAYLKPGDTMRFYEINPLVADFARRYFSYLQSSAGGTSVVLGDGRMLLEREPPNGFDLLVMDAFSAESIPVHLLTREAVGLYERHLRPRGMMAFNLSNMYLHLQPIVRRLAEDRGLVSVPVLDAGNPAEGLAASSWSLVGRREDVARLPVNVNAAVSKGREAPLWTDGFSSLLFVLH